MMIEERIHRKKDLVSILAVLLFAITILFEFYIIYLVPSLLKQESRWRKDVVIEELVELQDELRTCFTDAINKHKSIEGEVELGKSCLDSYARYFRSNKEKMTAEQAEETLLKLFEFKRLYQKFWYKATTGISQERNIDFSTFIKLQEKKLQ